MGDLENGGIPALSMAGLQETLIHRSRLKGIAAVALVIGAGLPLVSVWSKWTMGQKEYAAMLGAVEQAIAIGDRCENKLDDGRRKICEDLHRLRTELRLQLKDFGSGLA